MLAQFIHLFQKESPAVEAKQSPATLRKKLTQKCAATIIIGCFFSFIYYFPKGYPTHLYVAMVFCALIALYTLITVKEENLVNQQRVLLIGLLIMMAGITIYGITISALCYTITLYIFIAYTEDDENFRFLFFIINSIIFTLAAHQFGVNGVNQILIDPNSDLGFSDMIIAVLATGAIVRIYGEYDRQLNYRTKSAFQELQAEINASRAAIQATERLEKELIEVQQETQVSLLQVQQITAKLEASREQLEQFTYAASHDLKEPIRTVRSFMQVVAKRLSPKLAIDADLKEYFVHIEQSTQGMHHLLERLLIYSRVGRISGKKTEVDIEQLFEKIILHQQKVYPTATVQVDLLPDLTMHTDKDALFIIFNELIDNALKFTPANTAAFVQISATKGLDGELLFNVADAGIGIEEMYTKQVFGLFKRLHPRGTYTGAGIGLALVRKTLRELGGDVFLTKNTKGGVTSHIVLQTRSVSPT